MRKIVFGVGSHAAGSAFEQGRGAALAALAQAGKLPPALAILVGREPQHAPELLRGAREALGACPLVGAVTDAEAECATGTAPPGARIFLIASPHLRAKVGVGAGRSGGWEHEVREAFRDSFIPSPVPSLPENAPERNLYRWYLYRQPSLVLALSISRAEERRSRQSHIAAYLKRRLQGRTPILFFSLAADDAGQAGLADGHVVRSGVILTMIKTDLKFSLERFHSFEPAGGRLLVTRAEGEWIHECNGRPAFAAYREALGLDPEAADGAADLRAFALYPLARRGRDGRFTLLMPEGLGLDGSLRFAVPVEPDAVLYPMKTVSSPDLWRVPPGASILDDPQRLAAAVILRDAGLRDLPGAMTIPGQEALAERPVEIGCGREFRAYLSPAEGEGDAGHLLLAVQRELDPFAVAAAENERLLHEVVRLKDLQQKIFDGIGYGIALIDAGQRVVFCNNTYRSLQGGAAASPLEGLACPWSADGTAVCGSCAAVESIERNLPASREVVRLQGDKTFWYRLDTFPLRDASGKVTAAIEVVRDVTAFKDLGLSLESEQRKMEAIIRGMGETLYIVSRSYELQFFHRGTVPVGVETTGAAGPRYCHEAVFHRDLPCPWCLMHETMLSGVVERSVAHITDADGQEHSYQVTFSPWGVGRGDQSSVVCLLVDISAQKRFEQQMLLSEKLNSLSILSAGMAHELNNPLGAINFNLEILKRRERDPEYEEVLASIRKDVLRINLIVGKLLSFSRSSTAVSSGLVSLPEVIEASLELFQVVVERRRVAVRKSWAQELPPIWGNAQDLQQVFINLIANAVDAMPSGGAIDVAVGLDEQPAAAVPARIAIVYDNPVDLAFLRSLVDVPDCEVRFFHGDEEAIDHFRQDPSTPPEVLILDYAEATADRVSFFLTMMGECAPEARILVIVEPGERERLREAFPGVTDLLARPLSAPQVLERVHALVASLRGRQRGRAGLVVHFADTGAGIPKEIQERIFDPFFTTKEARGTGLGLSVVHKIVENHGASIKVASSPGKGTVFTLRFPHAEAAGLGSQLRLQQNATLRRAVT